MLKSPKFFDLQKNYYYHIITLSTLNNFYSQSLYLFLFVSPKIMEKFKCKFLLNFIERMNILYVYMG